MKLWKVTSQKQIEELNKAVNAQWELLALFKRTFRWKGTEDLALLWDNQENISEALNEAIIWEQFA